VPGLARLKERFVIAPCSNGHIAQSVNLAVTPGCRGRDPRRRDRPRLQPDPRVYEASVAALGLLPERR